MVKLITRMDTMEIEWSVESNTFYEDFMVKLVRRLSGDSTERDTFMEISW